jgi:hypothetical protein
MQSNVSYSRDLRERAKRGQKFLVTISVSGRFAKDQSIEVQRVAELPIARRVANLAIEILNAERGEKVR